MRYKHISELSKSEMYSLFNLHQDLVDKTIKRVVDVSSESDYETITDKTIKEEFNIMVKDMDEVIDLDTYERYILK